MYNVLFIHPAYGNLSQILLQLKVHTLYVVVATTQWLAANLQDEHRFLVRILT